MIALASTSKLRALVLERTGWAFRALTAAVDERQLESSLMSQTHDQVAVALAVAKANAVTQQYPTELVIAADTLVITAAGERLHKPHTATEAMNYCLQQSGQTITALTGICVVYHGQVVSAYSSTLITYLPFDRTTIIYLLDDGVTQRNSGLGFFVDAPGFTLVSRLEGSFTGAMGLPMEIIRPILAQFNYTPQLKPIAPYPVSAVQ